MTTYNVETIERLLTNTELTDTEAHKLYNNLGLAHFAARKFRHALRAHREEKRICKRLVSKTPSPAHELDLAISYRHCGDTMLKLDRLVDARDVILDNRADIIRAASEQHRKGLMIARSVMEGGLAAKVEIQAACAAMAQSALALALETRDKGHFEAAAFACVEAALLAEGLNTGADGVGVAQRESMLLGISVNMGIALSGLGEKGKSKTLFQAVAVRAKRVGDEKNLVRAVSNLAEEAGEEEDWELCEKFVREWIRLARGCGDEPDEADALRKLACVLIEKSRFDEAQQVLERALLLGATKGARDEARRFLNVVEGEIEARRELVGRLEELENKADEWEKKGAFVEEAKVRMEAGNCAFELQRLEDVARLLNRYFVLVDEYGCNTGVTGIRDQVHNAAVANMGEAMWSMGKYEQAVKWATRELTVYGDEVAGQAQAWCNLGVYLDDFGKRESAVQALEKSIQLAKEAGEEGVLKRAQNNLELVLALAANSPEDVEPELTEVVSNIETVQEATSARVSKPGREPPPTTMSNRSKDDAQSIIIDSTQPLKPPEQNLKSSAVDSTRITTIRDTTASKSHPSRNNTTADRSTGGVQRFVELATEYKTVCSRKKHPTVTPRNMIMAALRGLSSELLARQTCGEEVTNAPAKLDLSALFLHDQDVCAIFETLNRVNADSSILVDIRLNPLLTGAAYECLDPRVYTSQKRLFAIKMLDFSCAGITTRAVSVLAEALSETGALRNVTHLNLSKNSLGKDESCADAVAKVLEKAYALQVLDLSLNCLQRSFLPRMVQELGQGGGVRSLDLHLNNRKVPSAMLETDVDQIVDCVKDLFAKLKALECLDLRACGASTQMRIALRGVQDGLDRFCQRIVTVSPAVLDDLE